jgi:nitroreductase
MLISFLKAILPVSAINTLKNWKFATFMLWLNVFSCSRRMSSLYYFLFSKKFGREQQSVLKGRIEYYKQHHSLYLKSSALLRRNIHRLEKGLIMQPRRERFAADYIMETVITFVGMKGNEEASQDELKWAQDVLSEYFSVVSDDTVIAEARRVFGDYRVEVEEGSFTPYTDKQRTRSSISFDSLKALFQQRRSTRWFDERAIEDDKLDLAINIASLAPSACNRQPFHFFVANEPNKAQEIARLAMGTRGFVQNIPCVVAVVGNLSAYPFERDRHLIYIDSSLAAMQFMLACETLGLSSCPLNWPDIETRERAISEALNLKADQRVIMLIAVGYAQEQGMIPFSQKKDVETLRINIS